MVTTTKKMAGRPPKLCRAAAAQTAMRLFWRYGYAGVGIAALTDAIGVKSPSLYAAFGNKAGLFAAALDEYATIIGPEFAPAFAARDADDLIAALLTTAASLYTRGSDLKGCLALDGARNADDPQALRHAADHQAALRREIAARLSALGDEDADERADAVVVAMRGLSAAARDGMSADVARAAAARLAVGLQGRR